MIEISFVIPAYNVEKYIERCLTSIYSQDIDESLYEVIVVDDGSTDNTLCVLKELQSKYKKLVVVTQVNQGPSAARNHGLEICNGKYVWFVDSDDYIAEHALKGLYDFMKKDFVDAFYFTAKYIDLQGVEHKGIISDWLTSGIKEGKDIIRNGFKMGSSCIVVWEKDFLKRKQLKYNQEVAYGEDSLFMFLAISQAKSIKFINQCYYVYVSREGSLSTSNSLEKTEKQKMGDVEIVSSLLSVSKKYRGTDDELSQILETQANKILFSIVVSLYRNKKRWKHNINPKVLDYMKEKEVYPLTGNLGSWVKDICCFFLNKEKLLR